MKVALVSANLGNFTAVQQLHMQQTVHTTSLVYNDANFPPRDKALLPRLQAKIPRMLAWELHRDYAYYIWVDSTITLIRHDSVQWLIDQLGDNDIALFSHHDGRCTIKEELAFMKMYSRDSYIVDRYDTEPLDYQVQTYLADKSFRDERLYCTGCFIYRATPAVQEMMKDWYYHNARYSIQDQLSLPYVLSKHQDVKVKMIWETNLLQNPYISHFWNTKDKPPLEAPVTPYHPKTEIDIYQLGATFLSGCNIVEDWGCGEGQLKNYIHNAIGVDGSDISTAEKLADLAKYVSCCEGIFLKEVLEFNYNWETILSNAIQSAQFKICLVIGPSPYAVSAIPQARLISIIVKAGCSVSISKVNSDNGIFTVYFLTRKRYL